MSKETQRKKKYNLEAYHRYEFTVGVDTKLNYLLEAYIQEGGSVSKLVKELLCIHYGVQLDELYIPTHYESNKQLP